MDASILNYTVNDNVAKFLNQTHKLYINGKWVDSKSGKTFDVEDPATGKKISTCAAGDKNDIDLAVSAARKCFDSGKWHSIPPNEKGKIINVRVTKKFLIRQKINCDRYIACNSICFLWFHFLWNNFY